MRLACFGDPFADINPQNFGMQPKICDLASIEEFWPRVRGLRGRAMDAS